MYSNESLYIYKNKKCTERISIILFSPFEENPENILGGIGSYQFALVAFSPDKGQIAIRVYEKENDKLKFLEGWLSLYEKNDSIFKKENKFTVAF